jgi:acetyl-CoA synthetase
VHTTGGYMVGAMSSTNMVFDLHEDDVYWCTADVGWVTGHTYLTYGPLANGATCVMFEGAPDWPEKDRFWEICERYGVTILYTAPTAIRAFMKWATTGPPSTTSRAFACSAPWESRSIRRRGCGIASTSAAIVAQSWTRGGRQRQARSPSRHCLSHDDRARQRHAGAPGYTVSLLDANANEIKVGGGLLAIMRPWPSMLRTIWGDDARYVETYFSKWPGRPDIYFPGDGAKRDADGNSGSSVASTTCSTSPVTASGRWKWRARSWSISRR